MTRLSKSHYQKLHVDNEIINFHKPLMYINHNQISTRINTVILSCFVGFSAILNLNFFIHLISNYQC